MCLKATNDGGCDTDQIVQRGTFVVIIQTSTLPTHLGNTGCKNEKIELLSFSRN